MTTAAIKTDGLSKTYLNNKMRKVVALDNLHLTVQAGQVFGFLGPNGAGKSTTIKILTGQIRPTGGSAQIFGIPVSKVESRKKLGYLPENPSFYDYLTGSEYLLFVGRVFSMAYPSLKREVSHVLALLDLTEAADRPIRSYSKGMVQRLGIAQTLIHNPDLFIFDEPMSGLDPIGRALVKSIIYSLKERGKAVFFSTHITNDVELACDNFAILHKGVLMTSSSVSAVVNSDNGCYSVVVKTKTGDEIAKICYAEKLTETIRELLSQQYTLERVVPQRKSLEEYFLNVIGESRHENS